MNQFPQLQLKIAHAAVLMCMHLFIYLLYLFRDLYINVQVPYLLIYSFISIPCLCFYPFYN